MTLRGKKQSIQYLVGTTDRWNQAKRAELSERTKHPITLASADQLNK